MNRMEDTYFFAVMPSANHVSLKRRTRATLGETEVFLKVNYCGICGTDLALYRGTRKIAFPYSPGHEYTGTIVEVGKAVRLASIGDRVVVNPNFVCGSCYYCQEGRYNLCENADQRVSSNGGLGEYVTINSDFVRILPNSIDNLFGALIEPLACSIHASQFISGHYRTVLITGCGTMGSLILILLRDMGVAENVIVSEPVENKRKLSLALGATAALDPLKDSLHDTIFNLDPLGADLAIECSGEYRPLRDMFDLMKRGGQIISIGRQQTKSRLNIFPYAVSKDELRIFGTSRFSPNDMDEAMTWMASHNSTLAPLIGRIFPLKEVDEGFKHALQSREVKTIIDCS